MAPVQSPKKEYGKRSTILNKIISHFTSPFDVTALKYNKAVKGNKENLKMVRVRLSSFSLYYLG